MLRKWEELPTFMQTEEVRPYYEKLSRKWFSLFVKRIFDFAVSSVMLVILSPALLVLAVMIKKDSEGPIFYRQERITQYGRKFRIYKFRTMVINADKIGSLVTVGEDPRITKMGKKLRGCRLDELPQLINIWKGEMTFVGTRPEVEKYVKKYTPEMMATLLLPAGVTSEASIQYKDEDKRLADVSGEDADRVYVEKILPEKMKWNLEEIKKFGFFREIGTMVKTVVAVMR
ncbi:sugar transferase [Lachnospiraceae bacterium AM48-27BH]|nr:sugar transferase [Lachnospiraceae bacterium AM48-27BH]